MFFLNIQLNTYTRRRHHGPDRTQHHLAGNRRIQHVRTRARPVAAPPKKKNRNGTGSVQRQARRCRPTITPVPFRNNTRYSNLQIISHCLVNQPAMPRFDGIAFFWDSKRPVNKKVLARVNMYSVPFSQDHILEEADKIACEHGIDYNSKKAKELTSLGDVNPFANWGI